MVHTPAMGRATTVWPSSALASICRGLVQPAHTPGQGVQAGLAGVAFVFEQDQEFNGASADEAIRRLLDEHWERAAIAAVQQYRQTDP